MANAENKRPGRRGRRGQDLRLDDFPILTGTDDTARCDYVRAVYEYAVARANEAIDWYLVKKGPKKWWAVGTRVSAILLIATGTLIPLVMATGILPKWGDVQFAQFGFICLALAGACVGLDKFSGFSSAWMRYLTTATTLQRLLQEFYLDWAILDVCREGRTPARIEPMLQRVQVFLLRIRQEVEAETAQWASEYRSNLAEMEKSLRDQLEASRPGSIRLTVPNAARADHGVRVLLDEVPIQTTTKADSLLTPVWAGEHILRLEATVGGRQVSTPARVYLEPGRIYPLTLALPEGDA